MEFELNAANLSKPHFRMLIGIIFIVAGIFCIINQDYSTITRESCIEAEVTLYDMRVDLASENITNNSIRLIFDDYDISLDIHSSCVSDELLSDMLELEKGAKMKILHTDKSSNIYELWVNGEQWLDFDTAKAKIDENLALVKYFGYILLTAGAVFIISVAVTILKKRKTIHEVINE